MDTSCRNCNNFVEYNSPCVHIRILSSEGDLLDTIIMPRKDEDNNTINDCWSRGLGYVWRMKGMKLEERQTYL